MPVCPCLSPFLLSLVPHTCTTALGVHPHVRHPPHEANGDRQQQKSLSCPHPHVCHWWSWCRLRGRCQGRCCCSRRQWRHGRRATISKPVRDCVLAPLTSVCFLPVCLCLCICPCLVASASPPPPNSMSACLCVCVAVTLRRYFLPLHLCLCACMRPFAYICRFVVSLSACLWVCVCFHISPSDFAFCLYFCVVFSLFRCLCSHFTPRLPLTTPGSCVRALSASPLFQRREGVWRRPAPAHDDPAARRRHAASSLPPGAPHTCTDASKPP